MNERKFIGYQIYDYLEDSVTFNNEKQQGEPGSEIDLATITNLKKQIK